MKKRINDYETELEKYENRIETKALKYGWKKPKYLKLRKICLMPLGFIMIYLLTAVSVISLLLLPLIVWLVILCFASPSAETFLINFNQNKINENDRIDELKIILKEGEKLAK